MQAQGLGQLDPFAMPGRLRRGMGASEGEGQARLFEAPGPSSGVGVCVRLGIRGSHARTLSPRPEAVCKGDPGGPISAKERVFAVPTGVI